MSGDAASCCLKALSVLSLLTIFLPVGTRSQTNWVSGNAENNSIFCYQCNSGKDSSCSSLQANHTDSVHYKPCIDKGEYHGAKPFCRKIVQTIFERDNMVRVIRKCGWEKHPRLDCYYMSNDDHTEVVCQCFSDGCNTGTRVPLGRGLLLATPLLLAGYSYTLIS